MKSNLDRRQFLGRGLAASTALCALTSTPCASDSSGSEPVKPRPATSGSKGTLPSGKIGAHTLSRLISGGNLLSGWCHSRDLLFVRSLAGAYLNEAKQFDTLQWLEEAGVNSIVIDTLQLGLVQKYKRERGGNMKTIVSVRQDWGRWDNPNWDDFQTEILRTISQGPDLLYIHGGYADRQVASGKPERVELLGQALQFMRTQGFSAGLGAHALEVLKECDRRQIKPDFYVKTFHHDRYWSATPKERRKPFCVDGPKSSDHNEFHDNIFCLDPEATAEFMLEKTTPWIAFKVLAAGAIEPRSGFQYAFENGADFISVGMFDFEIAEDVQALRQSLDRLQRERPWCG